MMRRGSVKGELIHCSRCNAVLFLKLLGKEPMDGGYTVCEKYESIPDNWLYDTCFGYLCPECSAIFQENMDRFFFGRENVPKSWQIKNDPTCLCTCTTLYMIDEVCSDENCG